MKIGLIYQKKFLKNESYAIFIAHSVRYIDQQHPSPQILYHNICEGIMHTLCDRRKKEMRRKMKAKLELNERCCSNLLASAPHPRTLAPCCVCVMTLCEDLSSSFVVYLVQ